MSPNYRVAMNKVVLSSIAIIAITFLISGNAAAQSNLKFSKVILVGEEEGTVPKNTVWKIDGFFVNLKDASRYKEYMVELTTDDKTIAFALNNPNPGLQMQFPIWASSGAKIKVKYRGLYLSIVEYAISP
jgi:hypothetical protein